MLSSSCDIIDDMVVENLRLHLEGRWLVILLASKQDIVHSESPRVKRLIVPSKGKLSSCLDSVNPLRYFNFPEVLHVQVLSLVNFIILYLRNILTILRVQVSFFLDIRSIADSRWRFDFQTGSRGWKRDGMFLLHEFMLKGNFLFEGGWTSICWLFRNKLALCWSFIMFFNLVYLFVLDVHVLIQGFLQRFLSYDTFLIFHGCGLLFFSLWLSVIVKAFLLNYIHFLYLIDLFGFRFLLILWLVYKFFAQAKLTILISSTTVYFSLVC